MNTNTNTNTNTNAVVELSQCINEIDSIAQAHIPEHELTYNYLFSKEDENKGEELLFKAANLADDAFVTYDGQVNWDNIQEFYTINNTCKIYPIEQDRFGWLIGGIKTQKGIITFG